MGDKPLSVLVEAPFAAAGMTAGTGVVEVVVSTGTEGIGVVEVVEVAGVGSVVAEVASVVSIGMVAALITGRIEWSKFKTFAIHLSSRTVAFDSNVVAESAVKNVGKLIIISAVRLDRTNRNQSECRHQIHRLSSLL